MRLDKLRIEEFKNLRDLYIDFHETSPYTVLVGQNGSGKSNLIEALANIFRNLDLDEVAPFGYELQYECRRSVIHVEARKTQYPTFKVRRASETEFDDLPRSQFMKVDDEDRPLYRPAFVFGYYSGPTDRLAAHFEKHAERFYRLIIKAKTKRDAKQVSSNALRRLFYAKTLHGQFALLAFFMERTTGEIWIGSSSASSYRSMASTRCSSRSASRHGSTRGVIRDSGTRKGRFVTF